MNARISLSPVTPDDIDFITTLETNASLWPFEDMIPTDKEAARRPWRNESIATGTNNS